MEKQITMSEDFFEKILICLDNQKFMGDVNADGMSMGMSKIKKTQKEIQEVIDKTNREGRELLINNNKTI